MHTAELILVDHNESRLVGVKELEGFLGVFKTQRLKIGSFEHFFQQELIKKSFKIKGANFPIVP